MSIIRLDKVIYVIHINVYKVVIVGVNKYPQLIHSLWINYLSIIFSTSENINMIPKKTYVCNAF